MTIAGKLNVPGIPDDVPKFVAPWNHVYVGLLPAFVGFGVIDALPQIHTFASDSEGVAAATFGRFASDVIFCTICALHHVIVL